MTRADLVQAPDLPELAPQSLTATEAAELTGGLIEHDGSDPIRPSRVSIRESELRGVVFDAGAIPGLTLRDVILRDCGLSNVDGREGVLARVEIHRSQLVGFGANQGRWRDVRVIDSSLQLGSFLGAELKNVVFERVQLAEASFQHARLEAVQFRDCRLAGADFRGVAVSGCEIHGSSLDGVLGIESLRGVRMPWEDVLASAAALAVTLGIEIQPHESL